MGATFSHLVQSAREEKGGVGRAAGINTIGSSVAPLLFGVLLLSLIGIKWSLLAVAFGYLFLLPSISGLQWLGLAVPAALLFVLPAQIQPPQIPQGGRLIAYREGIMDSVAVVEHFDGNRSLRVNNRFNMGGTGAANAERRHAHIPLLLHPNPKQALFLGVGTGISLGAFAEHPGLRTDGVELVPEIIDVLPRFEPHNNAPTHHPQLKLHVADARRFVRATTTHYDVIVADLFHPARDGAGALYTREHFQGIRDALAPHGLFCQWLPLFQLDDRMLRVIVRTFLDVFPSTQGYLLRPNVDTPVIGLIGTLESVSYPPNWFEKRVRDTKLGETLKAVSLADGFQLFGCWIAGPDALRNFAQNAPLSRDDLPVLIFEAPRLAYQRHATAYGPLLAALELSGAGQAELPLQGDSALGQFRSELLDFIGARDIYIRGLVAETEGKSSNAIDFYVESARRSRHFSTGYAHCLTLAMQRAKTDPESARKLLQRLVEARPDRPVADELLKRLNE
jgi:spermidine synthase